ncbi:MAG: GxxExxY protein [Bacteroidota bacterium]
MAEQVDALHALGGTIVDSALRVHKELGPGLLESVYEHCLAHELNKRGIEFKRQASVPVHYDGETLDAGLRLDLLVNDSIVVEIKAVEKIIPVHEAQLLTYLKLAHKPMGFLINFNVRLLKDGIRRYVL